MIDVVFQLIIFFSAFQPPGQAREAVAAAAARGGERQAEAADDRPRLTVNVLADGTLLVANHPIAARRSGSACSRERRAAHGEELEVRIRGDRSVLYSRVEPVLLAACRPGFGTWRMRCSRNK